MISITEDMFKNDEFEKEIELENMEHDDEILDETQIENPELNMDIPDVDWAEDIRQIENPILREREIKAAKKLDQKEKAINAKVESGKLTPFQAECEFSDLRNEKSNASFRASLASIDLTWDHLFDVAEEYDLLTTGDYNTVKLADEVEKAIGRLGPDLAQEQADKMFEKGQLSKKTYDFISRKVRLLSLK